MLNSFAAELIIMPGMLATSLHTTRTIANSNFAAKSIMLLYSTNILPESV